MQGNKQTAWIGVLVMGVVELVGSGSASAGITYTSQARSVGGKGWDWVIVPYPPYSIPVSISGSTMAPDFGPFSETWEHDPWAEQNSVLGLTGITVSGKAHAWDLYLKGGSPFIGTTSSTMIIDFTIDEPTPFVLLGELTRSSATGATGSAYFSLKGPGMTLGFFPSLGTKQPLFEEQGVLAPGAYTLKVGAFANGEGPGVAGTTSFGFILVVPSPGVGAMMAMGGAFACRRWRAGGERVTTVGIAWVNGR